MTGEAGIIILLEGIGLEVRDAADLVNMATTPTTGGTTIKEVPTDSPRNSQ